jgi:tetratricopeptide (TPR) repeat protein
MHSIETGSLSILLCIAATCTLTWPVAAPLQAGPAQPTKTEDYVPPKLTAQDARRVEEVDKHVNELREAGRFAEAATACKAIVDIRSRAQGADYWETADARRLVATLERLAKLPPADKAKIVEAFRLSKEAERLSSQEKHAQAEAAHRRVLEMVTGILGDESTEAADAWNYVGRELWFLGRSAEAQQCFEKALELRRKVLGGQHPFTAAMYNNLGLGLTGRGRYAEAQPLLEKALAIRRATLGEDDSETGQSYNNLGYVLNAQGRYADAAPFYQKGLDTRRKSLGENDPDTAQSYNNVASNLDAQGEHVRAEALFRKALDIWRKALGDEHALAAMGYANLAENLSAQGRYAEAWPLCRKALEIRRKKLGETHPLTVHSCGNLGMNLKAQGRYAEAELFFHAALRAVRKTSGEEHPDTATSYNNLAINLSAQGRYAEAQPLYERALTIYCKTLTENHPSTANGYNNVAYNLYCQGRYAEAQPLYEKSLEIRRKLLGEKHLGTIISCSNLADNLEAQGHHLQAKPLYELTLDVRRKALGEAHPDTARAYSGVARNLSALGQYAEAEALLRKALEIDRKAFGEEHPDTAACYCALADNLSVQGRHADAEPLYRRSAENFQVARLRSAASGLKRASFAVASPAPALAACLARNGKPHEAWQALESCLARGLMDEASSRLIRPLPAQQRERQQQISARLDALQRQVDELLRQNIQDSRLQNLTEQRKAAEAELARLAADIANQEVRDLKSIQANLPADTALVGWLDVPSQPRPVGAKDEHWACVVRREGEPTWIRLPGSGVGGAWTAQDDELSFSFRQTFSERPGEDHANRESITRRLKVQRLDPLESVLCAHGGLPAVSRLVCLSAWRMAGVPVEVLTDRYIVSYVPSATVFATLRKRAASSRLADSSAGALLALGDPVFERTELASQTAVPPAHGVFINDVVAGSNAQRNGVQSGDVLLDYQGTLLSKPADLVAAVASAQRSPSSRASANRSSVTLKLWRDGKTVDLRVSPGRLGVLSNPRPAAEVILARRDGDRALRASRGGSFPPLPGTRQEVESIAGLFSQHLTLLGPDASEQRLNDLASRGELKRFRCLHLATHAAMNDTVATQSALILSGDRLPDAGRLAGRDGRLTAEKILKSWTLDADLVVLSACQSAMGKNAGGEGYIGFAQALFVAGARSLVLSLWNVDDRATALLMGRFYQNLLGKRPGLSAPMTKAEALREAKQWLRQLSLKEIQQEAAVRGEEKAADRPTSVSGGVHPYADPYYWAAFILIGDC